MSSPSSEPDASQIAALFMRAIRMTGIPFPFPTNTNHPDNESLSNEDSLPERIILVNPLTQGMFIIDGASSFEELFHASNKTGQPPASKESIDSMPFVEIVEGGDDGDCVVCLEEFEVGGVVKEMPCKHRFHKNCIEKWLGIHGSCPVCRYEMPVAEREEGRKTEEDGGERSRLQVWVSFSVNGSSRRNQDQNQATDDQDQNQATDNNSSDDGSIDDSSSSP